MGLPMNGYRCHSGGQRIITFCLAVSSVALSTISNMSTNVGQPLNTSIVSRSCGQNLSVLSYRPMTSQ